MIELSKRSRWIIIPKSNDSGFFNMSSDFLISEFHGIKVWKHQSHLEALVKHSNDGLCAQTFQHDHKAL